MHIFFSGIGGTAIGPLALIAKEAGHSVSGSDKQDSQYIEYLRNHGVTDIHIGQTREAVAATHDNHPIDWLVYSSAVPLESPNAPELAFAHEQGIKLTKRDELLTFIIREKNLKLVAVAGTHGKTTTTCMVAWLLIRLGVPVSYSLPAKTSFADMGHYDPESEYFIYEADEFDRNFLFFEPHLSIISGVSWDHHEIYPTREDYQQAFREFIGQSEKVVIWREDADYLRLDSGTHLLIEDSSRHEIEHTKLAGRYNRLDGWLAMQAVRSLTKTPLEKLQKLMNEFPGLQRRMEEIAPHLYTDYAHTPDKIRGAMSVALEIAAEAKRPLVVVYEPLTNRRQHYMMDDYRDCFMGASKVYWLPSYLAREDPNQRIIPPEELISHLEEPSLAEAAEMGERLKNNIAKHLRDGSMVVGMAGGGGHSLDEWLREEF